MIPLVSFVPEFEHQKAVVLAALDEVKRAFPSATFDVKIGLMVETPRARRRGACDAAPISSPSAQTT